MHPSGRLLALAAPLTMLITVAASPLPTTSPAPSEGPASLELPPPNHKFDYQIGGDYMPRAGVAMVSRDWFMGEALEGAYSICYVNAFQTQADEDGVERPDERASWPAELVLTQLGDDPNWGGEYLIDVSSEDSRAQAAAWLEPMIMICAEKGFDAVEFDNLDSWTRFSDTPLEDRVPFDRSDAVAFATLLAASAHRHGLAAQKNTVQLPRNVSRDRIGFDFAIAEECGRWDECQPYRDVFDDRVIVIEYRRQDFDKTCREHGEALSVVLRDVNVTTPGSPEYRYRSC